MNDIIIKVLNAMEEEFDTIKVKYLPFIPAFNRYKMEIILEGAFANINELNFIKENDRLLKELSGLQEENKRLRESDDNRFIVICKEWVKGCSCSSTDDPTECKECTDGFLSAILDHAKKTKIEELNNNVIKFGDTK